MVGPKAYEMLVAFMEDRRDRLANRGVPLPHPAVRRPDA
jgi:hypothetical protein